jgi:hypothetical protein
MYCELFEKGCKAQHNPAHTLGHIFRSSANAIDSDLKFKTGTLEYWEFGGEGDLIATLSYRFVDGKWYLRGIHFV